MRNILGAIFLFTILVNSIPSQAVEYITLSDSVEVSLLTMGPGQEELYSAFGHSALRFKDPMRRVDVVFNYGVFHFNQPNFYLNFTRGKLYYELGVKQYKRSVRYYYKHNRTITEQVLNLTQEEKQQLFVMLMVNSEPENKNYYYNYCYDNCSTRIRDMIEKLLGSQINYDYSYANDSLSYRDLMDMYLGQQPWGDVGIDFCLGSEIDRLADGEAYMYMPEYLMKAFDGASISRGDSTVSFVKETRILNKEAPMPDASSPIKPLHFSIALFAIIGLATHRGLKYGTRYKILDYILFGSTGLLSVALLLLWVATDHLSQWNLNILWCTPLNMVVVYFLATNKFPHILKYYFIVYVATLTSIIIFRETIPQELHISFIPIVLGLILRSSYWIYQLGNKTENN
ncbi:lipoprotein N-acyltransferase Lnb domain-containing protein [Reichenbachiella versicolor]|uniref:lipoprotein N-acyltransferase Lnb domain-containing protein n=1 Tax=Reichenbachiella versicolor TaxID=1821036 RepID=UPI000D6DDCD2|nr:DUF4105 domain-containing protein [Reichenbachiella versicolor]